MLLLQQGDLDALGVLYDRHRHRVYRAALGITNDREAAADLLQDVFLRMYRFAYRIDPARPLEPWLYRVTVNLAYTWVKRRKRWLSYLLEVGQWLSREVRPGPAQQVEIDEEAQVVRKAVASLPIAQRLVVVLYYVNGLSFEEISEILDVPVGTVKSRMHYARNTLKTRLMVQPEALSRVGYEYELP